MRSSAFGATNRNSGANEFGAPRQHVSIDDMSSEGRELLARKRSELEACNKNVLEAEAVLSDINRNIEQKKQELEELSSGPVDVEIHRAHVRSKLDELGAKHRSEIEMIRSKHEDELSALRIDFQRTLDEAEEWAGRHSEIALHEKMQELDVLKHEAQEARHRLNETTFGEGGPVSGAAMRAIGDAEQVALLERQISEITAITRDEGRDMRTKIDECLAAIALRLEENAEDLRRIEDETLSRRDKYESHMDAVKEEYALQQTTLQQQIKEMNEKTAIMERIIGQLGKHHERQVMEVLGDMDTMRKSHGAVDERNKQKYDILKASMQKADKLAEERVMMEQETSIINQEIAELEAESADLKRELARCTAGMERKE